MPDATNWRRLLPRRPALTRLIAVALLAMAAVGLLMACRGEAPPGSPGSGGQAPPQATAEVPDQQPATSNELQSRARMVLAARLSVPAESLTLINDEAVQWPDASLGCPQGGMMYAQVITPGRRMTFRHNENTYEVHTADASSSIKPVSCEGGVSY